MSSGMGISANNSCLSVISSRPHLKTTLFWDNFIKSDKQSDRQYYHNVALMQLEMYRVRKNKVAPYSFFAVFSAITWNFNLKFYSFIYRHILHLNAEWNVILLKNIGVVDFFNVTTYRFFSDENVQATTPI